MNIGIIGAGALGSNAARLLVKSGSRRRSQIVAAHNHCRDLSGSLARQSKRALWRKPLAPTWSW
jgi:pyrroline-5-carboxylate reductase